MPEPDPQTTKERKLWSSFSTPITITRKPPWWRFWEKAHTYEISHEQAQQYLNRRMKELVDGIKLKNQ